MKVFIIGITGGVGWRLAGLLRARGDEVGGLYRKPEQAEALDALGVVGAQGDITRIDAARLAEHVSGSALLVSRPAPAGWTTTP